MPEARVFLTAHTSHPEHSGSSQLIALWGELLLNRLQVRLTAVPPRRLLIVQGAEHGCGFLCSLLATCAGGAAG